MVHVIGARWGQYGECGFLSQGWMNMGRLWKSVGRIGRGSMRKERENPTRTTVSLVAFQASFYLKII
jgi:hypothetical protein